jgi:hypothetical protein
MKSKMTVRFSIVWSFNSFSILEHLCSIVASLFQHLEGVDQGKSFSRVLGKFVEENLEKVERLMELYEKYLSKVRFVFFFIYLWLLSYPFSYY